MDAINNMASAAAKVVWGESNNTKENENPAMATQTTTTANKDAYAQEPVSGKQGDVSKGEPFDAGNIEPTAETTKDTTTTPATTTTETSKDTTTTSTATTAETSKDTTIPTTTTEGTVGSKGPTTDKPSTTGDTHFKAAQADIRDPEAVDPKTETARKNVDDSGAGGLDESENPAKVDGPGPRPVNEVAAERGGDAGKVDSAGAGAGSSAAKPDAATGAAEGGEEESKGTGEQYVKSSGLAADGGDFDATKPGAGREADRLLEEKGIANPAIAAAANKKPGQEDTTTDTPDSPENGKEKKSLKDKIKAKLHKN